MTGTKYDKMIVDMLVELAPRGNNPSVETCKLGDQVIDLKALLAERQPRLGDNPPPAKKGWNHSDLVLVYYKSNPELNLTDEWSIAYYHYDPPFKNAPEWVDFRTDRDIPDYWWPLPQVK
jgi:hypothetical protein